MKEQINNISSKIVGLLGNLGQFGPNLLSTSGIPGNEIRSREREWPKKVGNSRDFIPGNSRDPNPTNYIHEFAKYCNVKDFLNSILVLESEILQLCTKNIICYVSFTYFSFTLLSLSQI